MCVWGEQECLTREETGVEEYRSSLFIRYFPQSQSIFALMLYVHVNIHMYGAHA